MLYNDSIVATPSGAGAIAVIRISGNEAITLVIVFLSPLKIKIYSSKNHTLSRPYCG
jgi:tRNA modification GTPase